MQRLASFIAASLLCCVLLVSCKGEASSKQYHDGVYTAEFENYDSYGYKDFIRVTVEDGAVEKVEYDAVNSDGQLRSMDGDYEKRMQSQQDTYPQKYSADLVNQFMENGAIDEVDDVAGASWSSACFRALYKALEMQMLNGETDLLLVANVPEK